MSAQDIPQSVTGVSNAADTCMTVSTEPNTPGGLADPPGNAVVPPTTPVEADPEAVWRVYSWPQPPGEDAGRRRRRRLLAGGATIVAVALLTGAGFAVEHVLGYGAYRYVTPQQFKGLQARADAPTVPTPHAHVSTYGTPADGTVMVVAYVSATLSPSALLDEDLKRESATDARLRTTRRVDAGPRGGAMACTVQPVDSTPGMSQEPGGECVWADRSMVVSFEESTGGPESPLGLDQLASDARAFRLLCEQPT
ncbi:hypothetical protein [Kitasatospora kifunensis]|uniref:Uncharacterized protein n=1 Tax=Kitasatospora kifunensis TaxID=58351 RepID=A0A7W7W032_KITKI|nr:hypothetical protein [Kitasatospora kifunensis]MBB4928349.1 hypothetical protein [Kitasatospora kifunensis]